MFSLYMYILQMCSHAHTSCMYSYTSIKKQVQKLQKEVGMAMPKSTQTRVVGMITYNRRPYITYTLQLFMIVELCMCM